MTGSPDRWHRWLLNVRFGGDAEARQQVLTQRLYLVRDKVLDKAQLQPGDTLLDVGAGDGLIAFGALERLGPLGRVIFSDISQDLLDHCRKAAEAEGLLDRCSFVLAPADHPWLWQQPVPDHGRRTTGLASPRPQRPHMGRHGLLRCHRRRRTRAAAERRQDPVRADQ